MENVEEISLRELIEVLLKWKKTIVITTILAMFVSGIISLFVLSPTYQVTTAVIVKENKGINSSSVIGSLMNEQELQIDTLISAFDNVVNGSRMLEQVRAISPDWEGISANGLKNIIKVEKVKDTTTVNFTVTASNPKDAATLANIVTKRFQEFVQDQNKDTLASKIVVAKKQMEFDMERLKENINKSTEELADIDKAIVYKKSIVDDPYIQELAARLGNTSVVNVSKLSVDSEEANPAYLKYLDQIASNQLELNIVETEYNEIMKAEKQLDSIAKETGMKSSVVRNVIEPEHPIGPKKTLNVAIAAVLGLMISVFYAFFMEYWRTSGSENNQAKSGNVNLSN